MKICLPSVYLPLHSIVRLCLSWESLRCNDYIMNDIEFAIFSLLLIHNPIVVYKVKDDILLPCR